MRFLFSLLIYFFGFTIGMASAYYIVSKKYENKYTKVIGQYRARIHACESYIELRDAADLGLINKYGGVKE